MFGTDSLCLGQTRCVWDRLVVFRTNSCLDRLVVFGTDSLCLGQTRCVWDKLVVFRTDSLCLG